MHNLYRIAVEFNFRVFRDTVPFHEYLTHENLLSSVEFEQYRSENEILAPPAIRQLTYKHESFYT